MSKEYVTNADLDRMEKALAEQTIAKNRLTLEKFDEFSILYNTKWADYASEGEMDVIASKYRYTVDIYSPVTVVDSTDTVLFVLPPMFSRSPALNEGTDRSSELTNRFDKALSSNHLLRDDKERALFLMSGVMEHVQKQRTAELDDEFASFSDIINNLKEYFASFQDEVVEPSDDEPEEERDPDTVAGDKMDTSSFNW